MDSSIIKKFRSIPSNFVFYRIIWSCQLKNFLRSKYCCLKISLLDSSSTSYIREVYFLPWISGMSHTKNNSLPSIRVNRCSYKIKSSILETSLCSNMGCSPISWIVAIFTETWVSNTWNFRWSNSHSFKSWAWNLNSLFNIRVISYSWEHFPIINTLETLAFFPSPFVWSSIPSCFV